MTSEEFIKRVLEIGYDVHFNDGVCWMEIKPFFYGPANPYQVIEPGKAKPRLYKALLGYRHYVSDERFANRHEALMILNDERLSKFGIESLTSSKRAQVRKGLKLTKIRKIEMIEPVIEDLREIETSKARRIKEVKRPEYYLEHYEKWRAWTIKQFEVDKGRKEYWGSFYFNTLIAIMKINMIDDTMIINYVASHSEHNDKCPTDALLFSVLEYSKNLAGCKKVSYGGWDKRRPTLNKYKENYGFERFDVPVYAKFNLHIIPVVEKILEVKQLSKFRTLLMSHLDEMRHAKTD